MIIIVANCWDETPRSVASRWALNDVGVLSARDLSMAGWSQRLRATGVAAAVIVRKLAYQNEISGVLTLLHCVFVAELTVIVPRDRSYVAAEMTSFLLFWLSRLTCPVLNRPTPTCLSGPYWRREKWLQVAAQAGIPVQPLCRHATRATGCTEKERLKFATTLTVVGDRVFGEGELC